MTGDRRPGPDDGMWIPRLLPYRNIYLAYDQDKAGRMGAQKLSAMSQRLVISPLPVGDLCAFRQQGGDLRGWLKSLLAGEI